MLEPNHPSFEEALAELEHRVRKLEGGEVSLEEALTLFEEGVVLAQQCHAHLDEAEQRVVKLVQGSQGVEEHAMDDVD